MMPSKSRITAGDLEANTRQVSHFVVVILCFMNPVFHIQYPFNCIMTRDAHAIQPTYSVVDVSYGS
jgi:hypothetical protein